MAVRIRAQLRSQELFHPSATWVQGPKYLRHLPSVRSWIKSGRGRTWTSTHWRCWHCKQWLNLLCHNADPNLLLPNCLQRSQNIFYVEETYFGVVCSDFSQLFLQSYPASSHSSIFRLALWKLLQLRDSWIVKMCPCFEVCYLMTSHCCLFFDLVCQLVYRYFLALLKQWILWQN